MKRVFLIGFLAVLMTSGVEVYTQFPQMDRMRRRIEQSVKANEPAQPVDEENRLPEPRAAVMNVDVQMVLSKAEHKTFAAAKVAEVKKVVDGEPLWLYVKFKGRLGDYVITSRDQSDPEKLRYTLFIEIAPRGDVMALYQYAVPFVKEDLALNEIRINLAPGLSGRSRSAPVFLLAAGSARSGVWSNELRLANKSAIPRGLTDNLATATLTLDLSGGTEKYRKMDADYVGVILRGSTDLTTLPVAGTFYSDPLSVKITEKLAGENIKPLKVYFSVDDWQEIASFGGSISKTKTLFATFTYRRDQGCFYGIAEIVQTYDFIQSKFGEAEVKLQKDLAVPCAEL